MRIGEKGRRSMMFDYSRVGGGLSREPRLMLKSEWVY